MSANGSFTPLHRGGAGEPLVLLHGFADTWRTWELIIPTLERRYDVVALTLPGHAGGPPIPAPVSVAATLDLIERALDELGIATAHIAGNSLGGYLALRLAERGRARSVVALAPAGGWLNVEEALEPLRGLGAVVKSAPHVAPHMDRILNSDVGRRNATMLITVNYAHIPTELLIHQALALVAFRQSDEIIAAAERDGFGFDPEAITCPVRIVWGTTDRVLPWPSAAALFQQKLPHVDWVILDDVGHCPQLDVPAETAGLIDSFG